MAGQLKKIGLKVLRLKTGTPMRLDRDSIDWALTDHTIAKTEFTTTFKR